MTIPALRLSLVTRARWYKDDGDDDHDGDGNGDEDDDDDDDVNDDDANDNNFRLMMDPMTGLNRWDTDSDFFSFSVLIGLIFFSLFKDFLFLWLLYFLDINLVFLRGYAFITYTTRDEALEAVKQVTLVKKIIW